MDQQLPQYCWDADTVTQVYKDVKNIPVIKSAVLTSSSKGKFCVNAGKYICLLLSFIHANCHVIHTVYSQPDFETLKTVLYGKSIYFDEMSSPYTIDHYGDMTNV